MNINALQDLRGQRYGLCYRLVDESDAFFIVQLRTNEKLGEFISKTDKSIEKQQDWIKEYKKREELGLEYYFLFESINGEKYGVSRIYNVNVNTFTTGSWLFSKNSPFGASFLGDIISHEIAFEILPNTKYLFDIEKGNKNVQRYALSFHPTFLYETEHTLYYENTKENFNKFKRLYTRFALK